MDRSDTRTCVVSLADPIREKLEVLTRESGGDIEYAVSMVLADNGLDKRFEDIQFLMAVYKASIPGDERAKRNDV